MAYIQTQFQNGTIQELHITSDGKVESVFYNGSEWVLNGQLATKDDLWKYTTTIKDCNYAITPGKYFSGDGTLNAPIQNGPYGVLKVETAANNTWILQTFVHVSEAAPPSVYIRSNINLVGWSEWV